MIQSRLSVSQTCCPKRSRCLYINKSYFAVRVLISPYTASIDADHDDVDDSSSMKRQGRWDSQKDLVERIARITTRILPKSEGVALRFINQEVTNSTDLSLNNIGSILKDRKWAERGDTEIGTYLRSKILKPLVYDKLELGPRGLDRPVLVSIITDGGPEPEPRDTLVKIIAECGKKLEAAKYPQESEYPM